MPAITTMAMGGLLAFGVISTLGQAFVGIPLSRQLNRQFPNIPLDAVNAVISYQKGDITKEQCLDELLNHGFNETRANQLINIGFSTLNLEGILNIYNRYKDGEFNNVSIDDEWLKNNLKQAGLNPERSKDIVEAFRAVPSLQDIITFANRDVFEPEVVERGKLLEGIPEQYIAEAKKRGLREPDISYYWASHWTLPSINQGFEMFQRLRPEKQGSVTFDDKDLDALFNAADIAPGYRPALKQIAYRTPTRVDIRRFYALGVFGAGQQAVQRLISAYQDIGFNASDAKLMADFTIRFESPKEKQLTKTQVISLYKDGLLDEDGESSLLSLLQNIGYSLDNAILIRDKADLEIVTPEEQQKIEDIFIEYKNDRDITDNELHDKLSEIPLALNKIQSTIEEYKRRLKESEKRMTLSEAKRLLKMELISEETFRDIAKSDGIINSDIDSILEGLQFAEETTDRIPSVRDVLDMYEGGIINGSQFVEWLQIHGFDEKSIKFYADFKGKPLTETELELLGLRGDEFIDSEVV